MIEGKVFWYDEWLRDYDTSHPALTTEKERKKDAERRAPLMCGALLLVGAMAAMVAAMAGKSPQIGTLMPVLASPLLSVHVMLVMCSYVLFMLMAVLSGVALYKGGDTLRRLARVNAVTLVPAVFLLTAGIFVGAVWANQSWGRDDIFLPHPRRGGGEKKDGACL